MTRLRLAGGLALAGLAGWWLRQAAGARPEPARTAFVLSDRLRRGEDCALCGHSGPDHDPDLGCTVRLSDRLPYWPPSCPCRRLGCLCPPGNG